MTNLIRRPGVSKITGMAKATVYEAMASGLFPRPIKFGRRFAAWPETEVRKIVAARIQGKSDAEIRGLVERLEAARANADGEA